MGDGDRGNGDEKMREGNRDIEERGRGKIKMGLVHGYKSSHPKSNESSQEEYSKCTFICVRNIIRGVYNALGL